MSAKLETAVKFRSQGVLRSTRQRRHQTSRFVEFAWRVCNGWFRLERKLHRPNWAQPTKSPRQIAILFFTNSAPRPRWTAKAQYGMRLLSSDREKAKRAYLSDSTTFHSGVTRQDPSTWSLVYSTVPFHSGRHRGIFRVSQVALPMRTAGPRAFAGDGRSDGSD
jgi:hypothetical protein